MNYDLIFALIFYFFLYIFFLKHRSRFEVQGKIFALFKTKLGIASMEKISRVCPSVLRVLGVISVITGFVGMAAILYLLIKGTWDLIFVPNAIPAVAPVLPGLKVIPGLPVLSFWHWIISIFIVAVIHEFCHGIYARLYKIPIKSSGFAFLGPILAAFVEPDEKILHKKSKYNQLAIFSAGPFSNILLGLLCVAILQFGTTPFYNSLYEGNGIEVATALEGYPVEKAQIATPFIVTGVNGIETKEILKFINATKNIKPGETVKLETDKGTFNLVTVENPDNKTKAFLGISGLDQKLKLKQESLVKYGAVFPNVFTWIHMLIFWLVVVNFGVGLFNLLPLGPIDGGRMFLTGMLVVTRDQEKAKRIWHFFTLLCLLLIFINILPFIWKLLVFIAKPLLLLLGI